ncbi:hypothetical protein VNI00_005082 [Paramarasmius palmivorus]|uniref:Uncharacterized protein n=1 Tax=Paramarasmius palmivorus TaxID=297713 RepID=A0AAW0DH49_9AGAR
MQHEHDIAAESPVDEDEDLFGSPPPPSPVRGRSPSPGLALPNSSNGVSLLSQNVGTIALPGSQHGSELAVNSLALPFSSALPGLLRPPAQITSSVVNDQCRLQAFGPRSNPSSTSSTPCSSRASSSAPTGTKPKKKGKAKSTASNRSSRPPPPIIPLPDPSKPLPPNWLRSQSALLGHAGLVGGIKPANLSLSTRGSTPSNPIVVDDSDAMAKVAQAREKPRRTQRIHYAAIDKMNLPAPSTKDIVDILLKQKEVLPVLQDLLKLVYKGMLHKWTFASPSPHIVPIDAPFLNKSTAGGSQSSDSSAPPAAKKRRLNSVPAGAVDWDVPYPFQTGEGPQKYQDSWAHERVRELVLQLVALIKTASRKAALRNYIKEHQPELEKEQSERQAQSQQSLSERKELEHSEPKTHGHYKPITAFYGLDMPHHDNHAESSNSSTCSIPQPTPADPSNHTIGQVITTLLGPPPPDQSPQPAVLGDTPVADVTQPSAPLDDSDGWLSLLQSFPTLQNPSQGTPLDGVSGTSTPSLTDVPMEFGSWGCSNSEYMDVDLPLDFGSSFEFEHSSSTDTSALLDALFGPTDTSTSGLDGLSLSIPQMMPSGPPSLVSSPMPSLSSMGDFPMTPTTPAGLEFGNGSDMAVGTVHDTEALDAASLLMALGMEMGV